MRTEHLTVEKTIRGFARLPPIPSKYGGDVAVYESSSAEGPHVWLKVECPADLNNPAGPTIEAVAHLTAENAWRLHEQLQLIVEQHYQGDAVPDWALTPELLEEREIRLTADHIEFTHERELAPGTTGIVRMHEHMHEIRCDWDHTHTADGSIIWKD